MLVKLISAQGPVSAAELVMAIGYKAAGAGEENVAEWHVSNLRKKIGPRRIKTVRGQGYVWIG